jgi:hypothetical protein
MHVAIDTFVTSSANGTPLVVHAGDRFSSDDPLVARHSPYFVVDGAAATEVNAARGRLFARRLEP